MKFKKFFKKQSSNNLISNCIDSREKCISAIIPNIGKVIEDEEKITCFVEQDLLSQNQKSKFFYDIHCDGLNYWSKSLIEKFNLNKPVYYIFDGIIFEFPVRISSHFSHLVFKNCTFTNGLSILWASNITLENNKYINWNDSYGFGNSFIYGNMNNLMIRNDNFVNSHELKKYSTPEFGINVTANNLSIINSYIGTEGKGQLVFKSENLNIEESKIEGKEIFIESDSISTKNSILSSSKSIMIENKNNDCNMEIDADKAPIVIYNGIKMKMNEDKKIIINKEIISL